jgi:hypothetical protein
MRGHGLRDRVRHLIPITDISIRDPAELAGIATRMSLPRRWLLKMRRGVAQQQHQQ